MTYLPRMHESTSSWLGSGKVVYSTGNKQNTPLANDAQLQELYKPYRDTQIQRRKEQAAQKAARKTSKQGHVTVYNAAERQYVSVTPQQARLIETANRNLATPNLPAIIQKPQYNIGEILNSWNKFNLNNPIVSSSSTTRAVLGTGTSTGTIVAAGTGGIGSGTIAGAGVATGTPNLPAVIQKGPTELSVVSQTVTEETKKPGFLSKVKGLFGKAKNAIKTGWNKLKAFSKTPKGKWAIVITAVVLAATALYTYVASRFSDKYNPTPSNGPDKINMPKLVNSIDETDDEEIETIVIEKSVQDNKTDKIKSDNVSETKTSATEAEKKEADEVAKANENKREPAVVSGDEYEVVEGDCVWNIAKAHLKELNKDKKDYTPSNVDILRHTKELMRINNLKFEEDNYVVIIQPKQKLKLKE